MSKEDYVDGAIKVLEDNLKEAEALSNEAKAALQLLYDLAVDGIAYRDVFRFTD